ncbi:hypothetical protein E4U16_000760 [Claviceps sp. LM84 group G4]|nr:hypothetical protein E4U16_000760 [Claviceps sp. LM84 group G4]
MARCLSHLSTPSEGDWVPSWDTLAVVEQETQRSMDDKKSQGTRPSKGRRSMVPYRAKVSMWHSAGVRTPVDFECRTATRLACMTTARIDGSFGRDGSDWKLETASFMDGNSSKCIARLHCAICNYAPKGVDAAGAVRTSRMFSRRRQHVNHHEAEADTLLSLALEV